MIPGWNTALQTSTVGNLLYLSFLFSVAESFHWQTKTCHSNLDEDEEVEEENIIMEALEIPSE